MLLDLLQQAVKICPACVIACKLLEAQAIGLGDAQELLYLGAAGGEDFRGEVIQEPGKGSFQGYKLDAIFFLAASFSFGPVAAQYASASWRSCAPSVGPISAQLTSICWEWSAKAAMSLARVPYCFSMARCQSLGFLPVLHCSLYSFRERPAETGIFHARATAFQLLIFMQHYLDGYINLISGFTHT